MLSLSACGCTSPEERSDLDVYTKGDRMLLVTDASDIRLAYAFKALFESALAGAGGGGVCSSCAAAGRPAQETSF
jgi:hypothetical protein